MSSSDSQQRTDLIPRPSAECIPRNPYCALEQARQLAIRSYNSKRLVSQMASRKWTTLIPSPLFNNGIGQKALPLA